MRASPPSPPSGHVLPSAPSPSSTAKGRPRLSPNERVANSYFVAGPRDEPHAPPGGAPFDFGFGAPAKTSDWGPGGSPRLGGGAFDFGAGAVAGARFGVGAGSSSTGAGTSPRRSSTPAAEPPPQAGTEPQSFFSFNPADSAPPLATPRTGPTGFNPFAPAPATGTHSTAFAHPPTPSFALPASLAFAPQPPPIRTPVSLTGSRNPTAPTGRPVTNARYTAFTPASLLALLAAPSPAGPTVLVLDLRTHSAWLQCRPRPSVNICVPSTLLRRPNHGVEQLAATLGGDDRTLFDAWNTTARTIIVVDSDSPALVEGSGIASLLAKFVRAGYEGTLGWVRGGFQAVKSEALGGSSSMRDLLQFGPAEGSSADAATSLAQTLASPGKHARSVLQVRDLPISAFQASSTSAFAHAGMPSASINQGGRSSAGSKASSSGRPGLGKRRKSGTEGFGLTLDHMSTGSATPAIREVAEKRVATNPFFDNIRQNSEVCFFNPVELYLAFTDTFLALQALSLERSLANLTPVDLPAVAPDALAHLPPFLTSLLQLQPLERAHRLAKQYYDLEVAERERLEGALHWHANVQGTDSEHSDNHEFKKFGISAGVELGSLNRFKNIFPVSTLRCRTVRQ